MCTPDVMSGVHYSLIFKLFVMKLFIALLMVLATTCLYINADNTTTVVTGTQDQCPCAWETWDGDTIISKIDNCN